MQLLNLVFIFIFISTSSFSYNQSDYLASQSKVDNEAKLVNQIEENLEFLINSTVETIGKLERKEKLYNETSQFYLKLAEEEKTEISKQQKESTKYFIAHGLFSLGLAPEIFVLSPLLAAIIPSLNILVSSSAVLLLSTKTDLTANEVYNNKINNENINEIITAIDSILVLDKNKISNQFQELLVVPNEHVSKQNSLEEMYGEKINQTLTPSLISNIFNGRDIKRSQLLYQYFLNLAELNMQLAKYYQTIKNELNNQIKDLNLKNLEVNYASQSYEIYTQPQFVLLNNAENICADKSVASTIRWSKMNKIAKIYEGLIDQNYSSTQRAHLMLDYVNNNPEITDNRTSEQKEFLMNELHKDIDVIYSDKNKERRSFVLLGDIFISLFCKKFNVTLPLVSKPNPLSKLGFIKFDLNQIKTVLKSQAVNLPGKSKFFSNPEDYFHILGRVGLGADLRSLSESEREKFNIKYDIKNIKSLNDKEINTLYSQARLADLIRLIEKFGTENLTPELKDVFLCRLNRMNGVSLKNKIIKITSSDYYNDLTKIKLCQSQNEGLLSKESDLSFQNLNYKFDFYFGNTNIQSIVVKIKDLKSENIITTYSCVENVSMNQAFPLDLKINLPSSLNYNGNEIDSIKLVINGINSKDREDFLGMGSSKQVKNVTFSYLSNSKTIMSEELKNTTDYTMGFLESYFIVPAKGIKKIGDEKIDYLYYYTFAEAMQCQITN